MFDQDNLENHLRGLAEKHEPPFNPADWADMQNRLLQAGLSRPAHSPLNNALKRMGVLVALLFLTGVKVLYDAPLPAHTAGTVGKKEATAQKPTNQPQTSTLPTQPSKTTNTIAQNSTTNQAPLAVNHIPPTQEVLTLPTHPHAGRQGATKDESKIGFTNENNTNATHTAQIPNTDSTTQKANEMVALEPVGFLATEPFMHKTIAESELNPLSTPENDKKQPREGYLHIEMFGAEALQTNLAFKMGTENLYSIFAIGYQFTGGGRLGLGYGFGKELKSYERGSLNLEVLTHYIKENTTTTPLNLLGQVKLQLNRQFTSRIAGFAGINGNVFVSDKRGEDLVTSAGIPRWMVANTFLGGTSVKMWAGLNLGINFRLQK